MPYIYDVYDISESTWIKYVFLNVFCLYMPYIYDVYDISESTCIKYVSNFRMFRGRIVRYTWCVVGMV